MNIKKVNAGVWVKASEELPETSGLYFVKAGIDKALWTRKRLVARVEYLKKEGVENSIEWLKPIEQVYPLTENELEQIKVDFYQKGYTKGINDAGAPYS